MGLPNTTLLLATVKKESCREVEKFMSYGFFHCVDSFLFVFTFLPVRFALAVASMLWRAPRYLLG